jgi:hypothetical protein
MAVGGASPHLADKAAPGALLPAVSFFGGFRTPAPVPVDRSRWPASETHHIKRRESMSAAAAAFS